MTIFMRNNTKIQCESPLNLRFIKVDFYRIFFFIKVDLLANKANILNINNI